MIDALPVCFGRSRCGTDEHTLRAEEKLQSFGARRGATGMRVAGPRGPPYGSAKCAPRAFAGPRLIVEMR